MSRDETPAVLLRRDGADAVPATSGIERVLTALGYTVAESVTTTCPEHNRFHVGPETVEETATAVETTGADCVVVDNDLHPGQAADLLGTLPPVTLRDRRTVVLDGLAAAGNTVAENRAKRRRLRVERRRLANESRADREAADARIEDIDRRCDRLDGALDERVAERRRAVAQTHAGTGARVVLAGRLGVDPGLWRTLTDREENGQNPLAPGEATTDSVTLEPGPVAVTRVPGLVDGLPSWYRGAVPGTMAAVDRADLLVLGTDTVAPVAGTVRALRETTAAPCLLVTGGAGGDHGAVGAEVRILSDPAADRLRETVVDSLPTSRLSVTLPYADDAHALVAWLHDNAAVDTVDYGDHITVTVTALPDTTEEIRRRVAALDGTVDTA
jgi:GTP-binding protein HflX